MDRNETGTRSTGRSTSFGAATNLLLERASAICEQRGCRLTELRRQVLGLVLESEVPAGAYELLERLRPAHPGAAPPTVYRALEFLLEQGLVHKLERLSAFVGCVHDGELDHHHAAQFLICTRCRRVDELDDAAVGRALGVAAAQAGFMPHRSTVEVEGLCQVCANG